MKRLVPVLTVVLGASSALAQTTPGKADKTQPAPKPVNNNEAVSVAEAMKKNGGSLFRATLATPAEPNQVTLREASYFSVPDPEPRVLKKHDLITVIVREESAFKSKGTTDVKRQSELEAKIDEFIKLDLSNWEIEGGAIGPNPPSIKANASRNAKNEGSVDRSDSLTARVTAEVVDVKPNGTLVLQGKKTIKTDDEVQQFILTGICRAADISADNTVLSTNLFDLALEKKHSGAVKDAQQRSWLTKLLDAINLF
jgi:flagellar L-ring protein precursor FlgH